MPKNQKVVIKEQEFDNEFFDYDDEQAPPFEYFEMMQKMVDVQVKQMDVAFNLTKLIADKNANNVNNDNNKDKILSIYKEAMSVVKKTSSFADLMNQMESKA